MCVDAFPSSDTREAIMAGLASVFEALQKEEITGELWVDGSFLTEKIDPRDVDVVLRLEPSFVDEASEDQLAVIDWLRIDLKTDYQCDSYVFVEYPKGHDLEGEGERIRDYWIKQFGFSRGDEHKGIAVLSLP